MHSLVNVKKVRCTVLWMSKKSVYPKQSFVIFLHGSKQIWQYLLPDGQATAFPRCGSSPMQTAVTCLKYVLKYSLTLCWYFNASTDSSHNFQRSLTTECIVCIDMWRWPKNKITLQQQAASSISTLQKNSRDVYCLINTFPFAMYIWYNTAQDPQMEWCS